jgi:arylsulfatase A-like enzyme
MPAEAEPARPNVLLVTIDTIRADHVGAYGASGEATPGIDAFARDGILFEQAIAPAPLTLPSHTTILSGVLPFRTGVRVNGTDRVSVAVPLLAEAFSEGGHRTAAFVSSLVLRRATGIGRGFAHYDDDFAANAGKDPRAYAPERRCGETARGGAAGRAGAPRNPLRRAESRPRGPRAAARRSGAGLPSPRRSSSGGR